jgi:hypothetical protein
MEKRTCSNCGTEKPLDKEHFRLKDTGFSAACRLCIRAQKAQQTERRQQKRSVGLQKIEELGVDAYLQAAANGGSNIPHSAEVIERVMQYFGGVAGFSAVLVKQYWDSPAGGSARNRLLETMCRLISKNVEQGGAKKPLALWTDDELERELNERFKLAIQSFSGTTIHVEAKEVPAIEEAAPAGVSSGDSSCA